MPDLIRLVHGNSFGIKKLVREFRLYWRQRSGDPNVSLNDSQIDDEAEALDKTCMDTSGVVENAGGNQAAQTPSQKEDATNAQPESKQTEAGVKTNEGEATDKKPDDSVMGEETYDCFVSKRQLEMKIMAIAAREKREGNKKQCWYVNDEVLKQYNMMDLPVQNSWVYISGDMTKKTPSASADKKTPNKSVGKKAVQEMNEKTRLVSGGDTSTPLKEKTATDAVTTPKAGKSKRESGVKKTPKHQPSIMAFTKKTPTQAAKEKKIKHNNVNNQKDGNALVVIDVDMETDSTGEKVAPLEPQGSGNKAETGTAESSKMEEDKTREHQPSIVAFTKKTPAEPAAEKGIQRIEVNDENGGNAHGAADVDMETSSTKEKVKPQSSENTMETSMAESSKMEEDCIVLDWIPL